MHGLAAVLLLAAARIFGPEHPVATSAITPSAEAQFADVASNGSRLFAAWTDNRSGFGNGVFATRIDENGTLLDPLGISLSSDIAESADGQVHVAARAADFLVGWTAISRTENTYLSRLADVAPNGSFNVFRVREGVLHDVATTSTSTLVISSEVSFFEKRRLVATLLDANLNAVKTTPLAGTAIDARVVATSYGWFVTWVDDGTATLLGARLGPQADLIDMMPLQLLPLSNANSLSLAATARGSDAYVAAAGPFFGSVIAHVDGAGMVQTVMPRDPIVALGSLALLPNNDFLIGVTDNRRAVARRVQQGGVTEDTQEVVASSNRLVLAPHLAPINGRTYAVVNSGDLGRHLQAGFAGETLPEIALRPVNRESPEIASDGTRSLVVWSEKKRGAVAGVLADRFGIPIAAPFDIVAGRTSVGPLAVVWDGEAYIIAYQELRNPTELNPLTLVTKRVSRDGVPDAGELILSTTVSPSSRPRLASDGNAVLIAWTHSQQILSTRTAAVIPAATFRTGGNSVTVLPPIVVQAAGPSDVAFGGGGYLMVASAVQTLDIRRLSTGGTQTARTVVDLSLSPEVTGEPAVAWGGNRFLIVWSSVAGVSGVFVDGSGAVIGQPFPMDAPPAAYADEQPRTAWDGESFVVAWTRRSGAVAGGAGAGDVLATRVDQDGRVLETFAVAATPLNDDTPVPFGIGGGNSGILYRRQMPTVEHQLFVRGLGVPRGRAVRH